MYEKGRGVRQDYAEAVKWFRSAAESGHASAQYNLAFMYAMGLGLPRNEVLAHMWFDLAALKGAAEVSKAAARGRAAAAEAMSAAEVSQARRLAGEWLAKHPGD